MTSRPSASGWRAPSGRLETLREKLRALAFKPDDLARAKAARTEAAAGVEAASAACARRPVAGHPGARPARRPRPSGWPTVAPSTSASTRSGEDARHLGRTAELMGTFRNTVVGAVGPRLSAQAAELFAELTDHEYDALLVDPETYEIRIVDRGIELRHGPLLGFRDRPGQPGPAGRDQRALRFQSGGAVGLLVLDEVFGSLDPDRKARMLKALERLRGRFRQMLVVTHDADIKEDLPNAIQVIETAPRRATARV